MAVYRITALLIGLLLGMLAVFLAAAQDEGSSPLLEMLALVPDNAATQAGSPVVSYADYRMMEAMRGITNAPLRSAEAMQTEEGRLWLATMRGLGAGMEMSYLLAYIEEMQPLVGFIFADIDRSLIFGNPPSRGMILGGNFDADAIAMAYTAREFTETAIGDVSVWCGPEGCEEGMKINLQDHNVANPFGGYLGRNEPLAVLPGYLADSADYSVVQNILGAYEGAIPSLADNPAMAALVRAADDAGTVAQLLILNFTDVGMLTGDLLTDVPDNVRTALTTFGTLPPYQAFALADVWDGADQEITLLMLVYPNAAEAKVAAAELSTRMETAVSLIQKTRFSQLVADRNGVIGEPVVIGYESGYTVAVLPITAPIPGNESQPSVPGIPESGVIFRLFVEAIYQRDLALIASTTLLPE